MKIRTDFVTNSSSSNFMVTVTVMSKSGKSYKFSRGASPYDDIEWSHYDFHGNLYGLMKDNAARDEIDNCLRALMSLEEDNYDKVLLKETDKFASVIESVSEGDEVSLVPRGSDRDILLDVMYDGKKIGEFPKQKGFSLGRWISAYTLGKKKVGAYTAKVVSVTPLSKLKKSTAPKVYVAVNLMMNDVSIPERGLDFESVEALCKYLSENVYDANSWGNSRKGKPNTKFIKSASAGIASVSDVSKIIVEREWDAYGEGADLFADNDDKLCALARNVVNAGKDPERKKKALQAMKDYINSEESSEGKYGERGFGVGCNFHYVIKGGDAALEKVARRLCTYYGPDTTHGVEHYELNALTGETKADAYFDLY